jgi:hypothetical protein
MPAFSGVPITRGRMRRTEKTKKYWDKNFELLLATLEQEDSQWL